jgi:hypothetical protein
MERYCTVSCGTRREEVESGFPRFRAICMKLNSRAISFFCSLLLLLQFAVATVAPARTSIGCFGDGTHLPACCAHKPMACCAARLGHLSNGDSCEKQCRCQIVQVREYLLRPTELAMFHHFGSAVLLACLLADPVLLDDGGTIPNGADSGPQPFSCFECHLGRAPPVA